MRMINGLAAAKSVILLNSKTSCSQPILLRDRRFLHGRQQVTHLIRLKVQKISRAHPFRDHQHVARHDHLFLRQRHEDEHTIVLEYLGRGRLRALILDQLRNTIFRIVFAFEPGISPGRGEIAGGNLLPDERLGLRKQERTQSDKQRAKFQIHDRVCVPLIKMIKGPITRLAPTADCRHRTSDFLDRVFGSDFDHLPL